VSAGGDAEKIVDLLRRLFPYREETSIVRGGKTQRYRIVVEILADRPWDSVDIEVLARLAQFLTSADPVLK